MHLHQSYLDRILRESECDKTFSPEAPTPNPHIERVKAHDHHVCNVVFILIICTYCIDMDIYYNLLVVACVRRRGVVVADL